MNFYDQFAEWLFNPDRAPLQKVAVILSIVTTVVAINEIAGFTFFYSTHQKVDQLSRLTNMIKDPATDSAGRLQAIELRNEIHNREPFRDFFRNQSNGNRPSSQVKYHNQSADPRTTITLANVSFIESKFWILISTTGMYLIFILIHFLEAIFRKNSTKNEAQLTANFIFYFIMIVTVAIIYASLSYIGQFFSNSAWALLFNFLFQLVTFYFFVKIFRKAQQPKRR